MFTSIFGGNSTAETKKDPSHPKPKMTKAPSKSILKTDANSTSKRQGEEKKEDLEVQPDQSTEEHSYTPLPPSIVAETDPLLGKVDAYVEDMEKEDTKLSNKDLALICLSWITFTVVTTAFFAVALMTTVEFFMPRPFLTFSVVSLLICLAFFGVALCYRHRWVRHMFMLCPLATALGVIAGVGVLCRIGGLLHFYQNARYYTNAFASQSAVEFGDAGMFLFERGETAVDTTRHVAFMDHWSGTRYCVAPLIDDHMSNTDPINFWVVGQDCCDMKSFHCHDRDGYSTSRNAQWKTALVVPHSAEITPLSWLTWLVKGAGQHDKYIETINVARARLGLETAAGALFLHWTLHAHGMVEQLSQHVWEHVYDLILAFAIIALIFCFGFVKRDAVRQGKKWPQFNIRKALNRRSYHHGLADEI